MSQIQRPYWVEHCVLRTTILLKAQYRQFSTLAAQYTDNMLFTTMKDFQELFIQMVTLNMHLLKYVNSKYMVSLIV